MTPTRITLHCTATANKQHASIEAMTKEHLARGFSNIGYHLIIQPDGEVCNGRALNVTGAHVKDENKDNLGIALVGTDKFTEAQFDVLRDRLDDLLRTFPIAPWSVFTHYQFKSAQSQGKTCPNIDINRLLAWYFGHHEKALDIYL